ncbi:MAG: hypothetical protein AB1489_33175 [Acidobacteriota bacterium]
MLKGFSQFRLDVANLSFYDLRYASMVFAEQAYEKRVKDTPTVTDLISANLVTPTAVSTDSAKLVTPKPYLIREIEGKRFPERNGKRALKVGFIGLSQTGIELKNGFGLADPAERLKKILPEVRPQVDLVVVLAYMPLDNIKQLIKENSGIDIILGANNSHQPPPAQREGNTIIAYAMQQTKSLGELRLYLNPEGHIVDYLNRHISLDSSIPSQAEAAKITEAAKAEIETAKAKAYEARAAAAKAASAKLQGQTQGIVVQPGNKPEPRTADIINGTNKKN